MATPQFDPSQSVKFDLGRGRVALDEASCRVLVPSDLLLQLCENVGEEARMDFGRRLGTECGRRVVERLGKGLDQLSVESLLEHLGGELALVGLGNLGVERWGRALVMTLSASPVGSAGDSLLAAVLGGAIQRVFGRDCSVVKLQRDDDVVRLLVASSATAAAVQDKLAGGTGWGDVLAQLHEQAAGRE